MPKRAQQHTKKEIKWNLGKPKGWQMYEKLTNEISEKMGKVIENKGIQIDKVIVNCQSKENKIKFAAFERENNEKYAGKGGRAGNVFKMKTKISGSKKEVQEPNAINNPKTGELITDAEEIKKVTLDYCVNNLQNKVLNKKDDKLFKFAHKEDGRNNNFLL